MPEVPGRANLTSVIDAGTPSRQDRRAPGPTGRDNLRLMRAVLSDPAPALDELRRRYGPVVELGVRGVRLAVIGDPVVMREMFSAGADAYQWGHRYNVVGVRLVVGKGSMIVSDGADHARRRRASQSAFSRPKLDGLGPMIVQRTDDAVDALTRSSSPGQEVDLYPIGRTLILGATLEAFFGPRLAARADEIGGLMQRPQDFLEAPALAQLPRPWPFGPRSRVRRDRRALDQIVDEEVALRRADPSAARDDLLGALIADASLSIDEIHDQAATAIGAGYDTTSAALAWMLVRVGRSPDAWRRLEAEADEVLGRPGTTAPAPTLSDLPYARNVVHESLRLHPAGLVGVRLAARDIELGGYVVRRGTLVVWSPYLAGRDPATWTDPLRFDPDRFVGLTAEQQALCDQAWVPFGRGPHMCLGFGLAQMELTLIISRLAQRLVAVSSAEVPRPVGMVVNRPTGGAVLRLTTVADARR
jgi:cytochrome P450